MKVRIKFSKTGSLKYIGHLDVMRYFQKLLSRSKLPICYSEGFSPHQIMSFAMPLSVGCESLGEYVDIELENGIPSDKAIVLLNSVSVPEIKILSFKEFPEGKKNNAMASISAASYEITCSDEYTPDFDFFAVVKEMLDSDRIEIVKKSKKSESLIDIKPFIYDYKVSEDKLYLLVSCGSVMNINPTMIVNEVFDRVGKQVENYFFNIKRIEMYTGEKDSLIPLDDVGNDIDII